MALEHTTRWGGRCEMSRVNGDRADPEIAGFAYWSPCRPGVRLGRQGNGLEAAVESLDRHGQAVRVIAMGPVLKLPQTEFG
jgi:hypothetical protein